VPLGKLGESVKLRLLAVDFQLPQPRNDERVGNEGEEVISGVRQVPGSVSPRYRGRVPRVSASYRGHGVHHEPGPHRRVQAVCDQRPILTPRTNEAQLCDLGFRSKLSVSEDRHAHYLHGISGSLRPSGYETDEVAASPYHGVLCNTAELDFRVAALPECASPYHPVTLQDVEQV